MPETDAGVVLAHGAWADGSSCGKVIVGLRSAGVKAVAAPLPLTSLADDVAALEQMLERVGGPVVVAGHAYAAAVIASARDPKVASLVYITALAPDEGETVREVLTGRNRIRRRPCSPDRHGLIWPPETQRFLADRMNAHVRTAPADHMPMVTAPPAVLDIVLEAVREVESRR